VAFHYLRDSRYFSSSSGILRILLANFPSIADIFGALDEKLIQDVSWTT